MSVNQLVHEVVSGHVSEDEGSDVYELLTDVLHCNDDVQDAEVDGVIVSEQVTVTDAFNNTDPVSFSDVGIQSAAVLVHVDVQTDESETKVAEIQTTVITEEASTDINTKLLVDKDFSTPQMIWMYHHIGSVLKPSKMMIKQYGFLQGFHHTCA